MKNHLFTLCFLLTAAAALGQTRNYERYDTTYLTKTGGNSELVLENGTRSLTNAFLQNWGGGRTRFAYALDSVYWSGDSLTFRRGPQTLKFALGAGGGGSYIFSSPLQLNGSTVSLPGWNKAQWDSTYDWWKSNPLAPYYTATQINNIFGGTIVRTGYNKPQWDSAYNQVRLHNFGNYLTKDSAQYYYGSGGAAGSLVFRNGLQKIGNEVHALYEQPIWNANHIQDKFVEARQPLHKQTLMWDSLNNVLRWQFADSAAAQELAGYQLYTDTVTLDATRFWVNNNFYTQAQADGRFAPLNHLHPSYQNYTDTATTDATRHWVQQQGYLQSYTETDAIALAKTITAGQGWGIISSNTAAQAISTNPSWNYRIDTATLDSRYLKSFTESDPVYSANGVPKTRQITINGTSYDLSADRSWTISAGAETDPVWSAASSNYYTKTNLQTSGQASVHWGNITNAPAFLTSETDPAFGASAAAGITSTNISNWNTAYGWGNHATAGYLTSYTETDPTVSSIIKNMPVSADATTNKFYYWNNGSIGRKQIDYSEIANTPIIPAASRFGVSGEDATATAARAFNLADNSFSITNAGNYSIYGNTTANNYAGIYKSGNTASLYRYRWDGGAANEDEAAVSVGDDGTGNPIAYMIASRFNNGTPSTYFHLHPDKVVFEGIPSGTASNVLYWNPTTKEITQGAAPSGNASRFGVAGEDATAAQSRNFALNGNDFYLQNLAGTGANQFRLRHRNATAEATVDILPGIFKVSSADYEDYNHEAYQEISGGTNGHIWQYIQGTNNKAGYLKIHEDSIVFHADEGPVPQTMDFRLRNLANASTANVVYYNTSNGKLTYGAAPSGGSMVYPSAGIAVSTGSAWGTSITDNSANWNTAYSWGNHANYGYLTSATMVNLYNSNGTLTGARTVTLNNNTLQIAGSTIGGQQTNFYFQPNSVSFYTPDANYNTVYDQSNSQIFISRGRQSTGLSTSVTLRDSLTLKAQNTTGPESFISLHNDKINIYPYTGGLYIPGLVEIAGTKTLRYDPATGLVSYHDIPAGGAAWGSITGSISNQTDLRDSLAKKQFSFRWYNAADYGITPANPDNTDELQALINLIAADSSNAVIYFPETAVYLFAGALQDPTRANAQVVFPSVPITSRQYTIKLKGARKFSFSPSAYSSMPMPAATILRSTLATGSGTRPSFIGGAGPVGGVSNETSYMTPGMEDVIIQTVTNPQITAVNFNSYTNTFFRDVAVIAGPSQYIGDIVEPTTATSFGVIQPEYGHGVEQRVEGALNVMGFYNNFRVGENAVIDVLGLWASKNAAVFDFSHGTSILRRVDLGWCKTGALVNAAHATNIGIFNTERWVPGQGGNTTRWYDFVTDIYDTASRLSGELVYFTGIANAGHQKALFTKTGGNNVDLTIRELGSIMIGHNWLKKDLLGSGANGYLDISYDSTAGVRAFGGRSFSKGAAFQMFGQSDPNFPGHMFFDYGSFQSTLAGAKATFRYLNNGVATNMLELDAGGVATVGPTTGGLKMGTWPTSTTYGFIGSASLTPAAGNYNMLVENNGNVFYNAPTGQSIYFRINNSDAMRINTAKDVWLKEITAPGNPDAGYGSLYALADGKVYFKNSAGTAYDLTAVGAGGGEANTASNLGGGLANWDSKSGVDLRFNTFAAADFNLASNLISIDYTNGQAASTSTKGFLTSTDWNIFNGKQAQDGDLDAIAALAGTSGFLKKTAANTWALDNSSYLTSYTETDPLAALKANNLSDLANPATARTNLGATAVGSNLFTATNPSAITIPRANADNTITFRTLAEIRTDISAQPLDGDLTTIAGFTGTSAGWLKRTGDNSWTLNGTVPVSEISGTLSNLNAAITDADVASIAGTETLTNKRVTKRVGTTASSSTPTPDADAHDVYTITALAANATFAAPTGTPTDGQTLIIRIKDNGTARTLSWNAIYRAGSDVALPTTTVLSKTLYVGFVYNSADSKWDLIAKTDNL